MLQMNPFFLRETKHVAVVPADNNFDLARKSWTESSGGPPRSDHSGPGFDGENPRHVSSGLSVQSLVYL